MRTWVKTVSRHYARPEYGINVLETTAARASTSDPERFSFCTVGEGCDCGLPYKRPA